MCRTGIRSAAHPLATFAVVLGMTLVAVPWATAQSPSKPAPSNPVPLNPADDGDSQARAGQPAKDNAEAGMSPAEIEQISAWIEQLGSTEFAARERAATHLMEAGIPAMPMLRQAAAKTRDAEIRLRATQIADELTEGDLQARTTEFLLGKRSDFPGWDGVQRIVGDSLGTRELFIELMTAHPSVTESLAGTTRDRAVAMESVVKLLEKKLFLDRIHPTRADAFALLLPVFDPNVPIDVNFDRIALDVLRKEASSKIHRDAQLSGPFGHLMSRWMIRSSLESREDVLFIGMMWDLPATLPLALQTLHEATQTETIATALQGIARFGRQAGKRDMLVQEIRPFLADTRLSMERGFSGGNEISTQVGDVAMATIAILHGVPLAEIGFATAKKDVNRGFILGDIGFSTLDEDARKTAHAKIDKLLSNDPAARPDAERF